MALYSYTKSGHKKTDKNTDYKVQGILIRTLATVFFLFVFLLSSLMLNNVHEKTASPVTVQALTSKSMDQSNNEAILGKTTQQYSNISISPTQSPTLTPNTPTPTVTNSKELYTVAVYGDSMVDTMGEVLEYLDSALKKKYPKKRFLLYNYGKGAENVEMGLNRFNTRLDYQSRHYQSLPELKPDILIIGSFAYNPFTPHDRDKHWLTLTKLVQTAKQVTPRVYMLAEIGPLREDFGKGPQGVNWSNDTNYEHSLRIIQQLENTIGLAKTLGIPLIDTFTPSFDSERRIGKREYVNPSDGIHPSIEGHKFMANKIAEIIRLDLPKP